MEQVFGRISFFSSIWTQLGLLRYIHTHTEVRRLRLIVQCGEGSNCVSSGSSAPINTWHGIYSSSLWKKMDFSSRCIYNGLLPQMLHSLFTQNVVLCIFFQFPMICLAGRGQSEGLVNWLDGMSCTGFLLVYSNLWSLWLLQRERTNSQL